VRRLSFFCEEFPTNRPTERLKLGHF